ncbi:hypothetical protein AALA54_06745 [Oscillospiraceae bacterium 44-34]
MNEKMPRTPFSTHLSGSARETEIRLRNIFSGPKKRPPVLFLSLMFSACIFCGNLVSCNVAEVEQNISPQSPSASSSVETEISVPLQEIDRAVLENIDLDGDGLPDRLTVVTQQFEEQKGPYNAHPNRMVLQAVMGSGQVLDCIWEDPGAPMVRTLKAGHLTSEAHEDILLELEVGNSNYAAAVVYVVRIIDGELTAEPFGMDFATLWGSCLVPREDSPLDAVRIPVSVDKWAPPVWYALRWNGTEFELSLEPEVKTYSAATASGHTHTLIPQGHILKYDTFDCFEQIQVWDDSVLFQTITEASVVQDDSHLFEGILRLTVSGEQLDIQDVNFDGSEDFGIYCGTSYNGPMYWFLWDEETWSFRPGFFSSANLTIDLEKKQLVDVWKDGYAGRDYYTYRFNDQGERELVDHQRVDFPIPK